MFAFGLRLEFLIQVYLSLFGAIIVVLEGTYIPGHSRLLEIVEKWCRILSCSAGKVRFAFFFLLREIISSGICLRVLGHFVTLALGAEQVEYFGWMFAGDRQFV